MNHIPNLFPKLCDTNRTRYCNVQTDADLAHQVDKADVSVLLDVEGSRGGGGSVPWVLGTSHMSSLEKLQE